MVVMNAIDLLQTEIRDYKIEDLNIKVVKLIELTIEKSKNSLSDDELSTFNFIIEHLLNALENQDYQLVDDLLEFELKVQYKAVMLKELE